ncbi:hypothetical protein [Streptomyces olivaceus]|uniref:hypothetical protein n=1 Tax=Streptomyces olivaceus TaxID=47716 RepID=UPI0018852336|nr:hypothetical protein [Streptomyces olivaceus]
MTAADVYDDLRRLLNAWDPIGVADSVDDEYDCMIGPLLDRLRDGADREQIRTFLHHELTDHFGLSLPYDVDGMADRVMAWWTSTRVRGT